MRWKGERMRKIYEAGIILILISMLFTGCSSLSKVKQLELSNEALQVETEKLKEASTILEQKLVALENKEDNLKNQLEEMEKTLKRYKEEIEAEKKVEDLHVIDKDNTGNESHKTRVYVEEYGSMPPSRSDSNTLFFKGIGEGEYLELKVEGKITNLRSVQVAFSENEAGEFTFVDQEVIVHADQVENQTVIIETFFACGIPSVNVRWDDEEEGGNLVLTYDGKEGLN